MGVHWFVDSLYINDVCRDLADAFGPQLKPVLGNDWVESFLKQGRSGRGITIATKEVAKWSKAVGWNLMTMIVKGMTV